MLSNIHISDRSSLQKEDNYISYYVGPIYIKLDTNNSMIVISNPSFFIFNLNDLLPLIIRAWDIKNTDIIKTSQYEITIKYDLHILNNYLTYNLIFF